MSRPRNVRLDQGYLHRKDQLKASARSPEDEAIAREEEARVVEEARQRRERQYDLFLARWYGVLPPKQFCACLMVYVFEMSYEEIANWTGKQPGALRKNRFQGERNMIGEHGRDRDREA